jgi:hypothetical protein
MTVILFSCLTVPYIFSGVICWLAFLRNFNQQNFAFSPQWLLAVLVSFVIVAFWCVWIIIEITKLTSLNPKVRSLAYAGSDSDFCH